MKNRTNSSWLEADAADYLARAARGWRDANPGDRSCKKKASVPSEHEEQAVLIYWASVMAKNQIPELKLLFAIPNGGLRDKVVAAKLQAEGVKPGVPDLMLPVARHGFHGLYIEMKRISGGRVSDEQKFWHAALIGQGYCVVVCEGAVEAMAAINNYLGIKKAIMGVK